MWNSTERMKFSELMAMLAENYGREYSQALQKAWEAKLSQYPFKQVEDAIYEYMATKKFPPKLADIVEILERPHALDKETAEAMAEQAWAEVLSYMATIGAYESVKFRDPIINAVIKQLGGWVNLCQKTYPELETNTKWDFKKMYIAYALSGICPEVNYLPGINELVNEQAGYHEVIKPPKLIGRKRVNIQLVNLRNEIEKVPYEGQQGLEHQANVEQIKEVFPQQIFHKQ